MSDWRSPFQSSIAHLQNRRETVGRLDRKFALVTGASRGIGRAIALELAREGASVALNYRSGEAEAQAVADEIAKLGGQRTLVQAGVAHKGQGRAMVKKGAEQLGR